MLEIISQQLINFVLVKFVLLFFFPANRMVFVGRFDLESEKGMMSSLASLCALIADHLKVLQKKGKPF